MFTSDATKGHFPQGLFTFEIRHALFHVSRETFLGVFTGKKKLLQFALDAESFAETDFRAGDDGALDATLRARSFIRPAELLRIREHIVPERFALIDVIDQAHLESFFEAEGLAGGHEFEGFGATDYTRQALRPAGAGKHAKVYFRQAD